MLIRIGVNFVNPSIITAIQPLPRDEDAPDRVVIRYGGTSQTIPCGSWEDALATADRIWGEIDDAVMGGEDVSAAIKRLGSRVAVLEELADGRETFSSPDTPGNPGA